MKTDGSLWEWGVDHSVHPSRPIAVPTRLDVSADWVEVRLSWRIALGLKRDGSLWLINFGNFHLPGRGQSKTHQIGCATDWQSLGSPAERMLAIKKDGSLWKISLPWNLRNGVLAPNPGEPTRLGHSTNWIAASGFAALGADGSLIGSPYAGYYATPPDDKIFYLYPTRRCPFVLNLAPEEKP